MVVFNPQKKEIDIKIVYYGPALCGKTTNLKSVHLNLNPQQRGELISLATKDDRTLFFDFLPIQLDNIKGFKTRFHIYTVPGQVFYTLTRKAVLTGVDGVIFVADSQNDKMRENIESLNDLKDNLKYYNKTLDTIPLVFQYNKRDLPGLVSPEEMNEQLNSMRAPFFEACALSGKGVMETLTMCCKMVLKQMQSKTKVDKPDTKIVNEASAAEIPAVELPCLTLSDKQADKNIFVADHPKTATSEDIRREEEKPSSMGNGADRVLYNGAGVIQPEAHAIDENDGLGIKERAAGEEIRVENAPLAQDAPGTFELKIEDGKRICPRCSLKFKPNVKQCPICRINLVPDEQGSVKKGSEFAAAPQGIVQNAATRPAECISPGYTIPPDNGNDMQQLEIVSCDQPLKASSHAITIPLIMRHKESNAHVKFELTISFNNTLHEHNS